MTGRRGQCACSRHHECLRASTPTAPPRPPPRPSPPAWLRRLAAPAGAQRDDPSRQGDDAEADQRHAAADAGDAGGDAAQRAGDAGEPGCARHHGDHGVALRRRVRDQSAQRHLDGLRVGAPDHLLARVLPERESGVQVARLLEGPRLEAAHDLLVPVGILLLLQLELPLLERQHRRHVVRRGPRLLQLHNLPQREIHQLARVGRVAAEAERDVPADDALAGGRGRPEERRHAHGVHLPKLEAHQLHEAALQEAAADGDPHRLARRARALDVHRERDLRLRDGADHGHPHVLLHAPLREAVRQRRHLPGADLLGSGLPRDGCQVLLQQRLDLLQVDVPREADRVLLGVGVRLVEVVARHLRVHRSELAHGEGRKVVAAAIVDEAHAVGEGVHGVPDLRRDRLAGHMHHRRQLLGHRLHPAGEELVHELQRRLQVLG
mmetsp:Transcript_41993/g.105341  ORF Transcript_41993/g.105341 Transcript_41993/m.105341 type:complete len:436 (+) Transcript_41993:195-1502(+)